MLITGADRDEVQVIITPEKTLRVTDVEMTNGACLRCAKTSRALKIRADCSPAAGEICGRRVDPPRSIERWTKTGWRCVLDVGSGRQGDLRL